MIFDEIINSFYESHEYPALDALTIEWSCTRPLEGIRVIAATPVFRNSLVQYRALLAAGADLYIGVGTVAGDEKIKKVLKDFGFPIVTPADILESEAEDDYFDLILDCAGQFSACHPKYGFVELTRSGVHLYEDTDLPVYVADSGIVKRIEASLGTGDGYFRALNKMGYDPNKKSLLVFGSGKIGTGIALQGVSHNCKVTVVTDLSNEGTSSDFSRVLFQNNIEVLDCHEEKGVACLIKDSDFIVTATGKKDALNTPILADALLNTKALLANMGVEDEYGKQVPASRVLGEKIPLNFTLEEPTHLKYIDASLALHASLGERLVKEYPVGFQGLNDPPPDLEKQILLVTLQNGIIGPEVCDLLGGISEE